MIIGNQLKFNCAVIRNTIVDFRLMNIISFLFSNIGSIIGSLGRPDAI